MREKIVILVMGLPGSGKTTLALELKKYLNATWINADVVRKKYKNWDFSKNGVIKQARRMREITNKSRKKIIIADFVCPYGKGRKIFNPDYLIWMNTIKKGRFPTFDKSFETPKKFDFKVNKKNAKFYAKKIIKDMNKKLEKNVNLKTAVILCGGKGTRLGLLGKRIPKSLVKIHELPIIWYIINTLKKNSFNHFILPTGYKGKMIEKYLKKNKNFKKSNIDIVPTGKDTSIAKRIFLIKKKIKSKNFLLLNGDAIFDFNLKKMVANHDRKNFDITFVGCEAQLNFGIIGKVNNKIVSFERDIDFNSVKTKNKKNFIGFINSGISIIKSELLKHKFKNYNNFEKEFYPRIIKKHKSNFESISGFWHSIDNVKDIDILKRNGNIKKYKITKKILKKLKSYEKK